MQLTLGKRIMHHRKRLKLTQDQLAEKLGVTAQAVSKWENDQSCPDISMLPRLSEIFHVTTDELLGTSCQETVHEAEVVNNSDSEPDHGIHVKKGDFEFRYESGRKGFLSFALFICAVGLQLFIAKLCNNDISFWSILWPTAMISFGCYGLLQKFSFLKIGCILFGCYFLTDNWDLISFHLGGELLFPSLIIILGLSLLADAMRRPKKAKFSVFHPESNNNAKRDYQVGEDSFVYSSSFSENTQVVCMPVLSKGDISTSFGEYTIDLSGVAQVSPNCHISAAVNFGELILLVPSQYAVITDNSTAFASIDVSGHHDEEPVGVIHMDASANFGEIEIRYI